jgi:RalA-binding protein 1
MDERHKKIQTFNVLVHKLPQANFELLRHLSSFLIEIVDNAGLNKMTVRNVGIVFAPTLNIPAPLISFFLTDYPDIFGTALDEASSPIHEIRNNTSHLGDDAIRSPRRQMFSDLPTPAYNQTSFQQPYDRQPQQQPYDRQPQQYQPLAAPSYPPPQPPQQQAQNAGYDAGFIPIRPSYEAPSYEQHAPTYEPHAQKIEQRAPSYEQHAPTYEPHIQQRAPTYEQHAPLYEQPYQGEGYGSLNGAVNTGTAKEQRQKRRESGMLLMNMGMGAPRQASNGSSNSNNARGVNPLMVREETAFD